MKELGPDTDAEHQKIADLVASNKFSKVIFVGENFSNVKTEYPHYKNFEELRQYLSENPITDSYVLLKGSRGMQLENCIELL